MHDGSSCRPRRSYRALCDRRHLAAVSVAAYAAGSSLSEQQTADLIAFLKTLTGKKDIVALPILPELRAARCQSGKRFFLGFAAGRPRWSAAGCLLYLECGQYLQIDGLSCSPNRSRRVENARGAWSDFRHAQDHVTKVVSMTSPVETSDSAADVQRALCKILHQACEAERGNAIRKLRRTPRQDRAFGRLSGRRML